RLLVNVFPSSPIAKKRGICMHFRALWFAVLGLMAGAFGVGFFCGKSLRSETASGHGPGGAPAGLGQGAFGGGCFWCTEAVFGQLKGVQSVVSGYSGGLVDAPSYEQVCSGSTGHAEAIQITYDPSKISYEELLEVFWKTHDPTTLNRQGHDV